MAVGYLLTGICPKILIGNPMIKLSHESYDYISHILNISLTTCVDNFQGTWAFQSLHLSRWPKNSQAPIVHGRLDDLESFYHVLFWVSLQHAQHRFTPTSLYNHLNRLFDHALIIDNNLYSSFDKDVHMKSTAVLEGVQFENPPLRKLLFEISNAFAPLYKSSRVANEISTAYVLPLSTRSAGNVEDHEADIRILNSQTGWKIVSRVR